MAGKRKRPHHNDVTMQDIADHLGLSPMTVSRALNGKAGVGETTRREILECAKRLDYTPNPSARSLATSRSNIISLLLHGRVRNYYFCDLVDGAITGCRANDYQLIVEYCGEHPTRVDRSVLDRILRSHPDGILAPERVGGFRPIMSLLESRDIPHVLISSNPQDSKAPYVCIDNYQAAYDVTEHLAALGHVNIGFIKGHSREYASELRYRGYRGALANRNLSPVRRNIARGDFSEDAGYELTKKMLSHRRRPTAIFASNDIMASGALHAAYSMGIGVPGEVSIAGFDDTQLARVVSPPLTSVSQDLPKQAERAAELVIELINNPALRNRERATRHQLEHQLSIRRSTAPPPSHPRR